MTDERRAKFFDAGFVLLGEHGYAGLKLAPLCESLGVTSGAFYHAFAGWKDFTTQLLAHWRDERTAHFVDLVHGVSDGVTQLETLRDATLGLPHSAEAAIRVWASLDPDVAAVQAEVDRERLEVVVDAFADLFGADEAHRFARLGMMVLVGFEQQSGPHDPDVLQWALTTVLDAALIRQAAHS